MDPLTLALIMGGGTMLNELTAGKDRKNQQAALKAEAYRVMPYTKIDPTSWEVYEPDPLGKGVASGVGGYQLGANAQSNNAYAQALEAYRNKTNKQAGLDPRGIQDTTGQGFGTEMPNGLDPVPMEMDQRGTSRTYGSRYNPYRAARGYQG